MNLKNLIISLLTVVASLHVLSCCGNRNSASSDANRRLSRAETVVDSVPEEAMVILDSIDFNSLDRTDRHRATLLRGRLQYEGDSLPASDSLMAATASYFGDRGDRDRRMQTLFIQAQIRRNNGDYAGAMRLACEGGDLADDTDIPLWQGRFALLKADLFSSTGDFANGAAYSLAASRAYSLDNSGTSVYRSLFASLDAAADYADMLNFRRSTEIIDSIESLIPGQSAMDSSLRRYAVQLRIPAALHTNQPRKALDLFKKIRTYSSYRSTPFYILLEARALMSVDSFDKASPMVEYAGQCATSPSERINYYESLKYIALNQGDVRLIDLCNDSIHILNTIIAKHQYNTDLSSTLQSIVEENSDARLKTAHRDNAFLAITAILISGLLLVALIKIRKRKKEIKAKNKELKQNEENLRINLAALESSRSDAANKAQEIIELSESLKSNLSKIADIRSHSSSLFILGKSTLTNLLDEYESIKDNPNLHKQIVSRLAQEIEKLDSPDTFENIEVLMNLLHDDTVNLLREEFPEMKEADVRLLMLNLAGWSPRSIALFLKLSKQNCATRKSRVIEKIRNSSAPHRDLFISKFYYKPENPTDR